MKLYTINATSIRPEYSAKVNQARFDNMPYMLADTFKSVGIDGFTLYEVVGFWMGEREPSYKIEVLTELDFDGMAELCEQIRHVYNQDAVILQCGEIVKFIERP